MLTGMGGVGKTQLAAHYVRGAWQANQIDLLVWVTATTRSAVIDTYAQAATSILDADPTTPESAAAAFLAWLEPKGSTATGHGGTTAQMDSPPRWFIVLDDLTDPADLRGLWPPASANGRTLITTRRRDAALTSAVREPLTVGLFTPEEAAAYLSTALAPRDSHESIEQLSMLANDLGCLPLALSQAAAYLLETDLSCVAYRQLLADRTVALTAALPDASSLPDDQTNAVPAAWSLSIDRVDRMHPVGLARPVLQLVSMLDPNGVPGTVLSSQPALDHFTKQRTPPFSKAEGHATGDKVDAALKALHRLSLVDYTPGTSRQTVRVHQLVQRAVRDALTPDLYAELAQTAADALTAVWPEVERDILFAGVLRANTTALTRHAADLLWYTPPKPPWRPASGRVPWRRRWWWRNLGRHPRMAHPVLHRTGRSLWESGQATEAVAYGQNLADWAQHHLGRDHPETLKARNNVLVYRSAAGDVAGPAAAGAELLTDFLRVLGPNHPETLTARANLAHWRDQAGDTAGATAATADLLKDFLRVFGPAHPDTLAVRKSLVDQMGRAGDAAGAVAASDELVADCSRALGPDHPDTLTARSTLANWLAIAGDAAGAAAAFDSLLEDYVRVLGPDHPETLTARFNLAHWRASAGDSAGAAATTDELLKDYLRVLGPDHPNTLLARRSLANWRASAGDAAGAAAAMDELVKDYLRVLGPDHPDTLDARSTLANWRWVSGDLDGGAALIDELVKDYSRVLGPDHPDTLLTRGGVAQFRSLVGDAAGATAAATEVLGDQIRVLGIEHPITLRTRQTLAQWMGAQGDPCGAAAGTAEVLEVYIRVLGPEHPDTLSTRDNLTYWRGVAGDPAGAAAAAAALLEDRLRILGPEHPDTLSSRSSLAKWQGESGDAPGAAALFAELLEDYVRVLGPDHPDTLAVRNDVNHWQERAASQGRT
ncbi:tetratricopeptide repeat protein [Streptomyces goshikiensis]|uniref:tetratricopeptide repeat protein n=1 Tax=Streptomyces goshikiensis TaxID=1942 RepID=UPI0033171134